SSPHDPDSGAFRILDRELEEGYRLSAPGLDFLSRRAGRPERRDGHRGRDFARAQDDARHHDLLPLRRIAAQPREVDLGPVLAGPFEPVRHVPPDRGSRLAGNIPESLDRTLRDGIEDIHNLGLTAMEVQLVRVNLNERYAGDEDLGRTPREIPGELIVQIGRKEDRKEVLVSSLDEKIEKGDVLYSLASG